MHLISFTHNPLLSKTNQPDPYEIVLLFFTYPPLPFFPENFFILLINYSLSSYQYTYYVPDMVK